MTPNCSGLTPNAVATGRKIGVQMMISGAMSMNVPSTSSTTFISDQHRRRVVGELANGGDDLRGHLQVGQQPAERRRGADHEQDEPAVCAALAHAAMKLAPAEASVDERRDDDAHRAPRSPRSRPP